LKWKHNLTWSFVRVFIPSISKNTLLPLNIVTVLWDTWYINILDETNSDFKISKFDIKFWKIFGEYIEILSDIPDDLKIITSDISRYDNNRFEIKIK
jgi:hypothetical protein